MEVSKEATSNQPLSARREKPRIIDYDDVHRYLADYCDWRHQTDRNYSYGTLAAECGFASRTFARLLVLGQRKLTEVSLHKLARGLKLKANEQEYLVSLAKFKQATDADERDFHSRKIFRTTKVKPHAIAKSYVFLSNKYLPRLLTLLALPNVDSVPRELARILGLAEPVLLDLLTTLEGLGLAVPREDDRWDATVNNFTIEDSTGDLAIQTYHRKNMDDFIAGLSLPASERDFRCALVPLSGKAFAELQRELADILLKLAEKYERTESPDAQKIYLIGMNTVPVGHEFGGNR